MTLYTCCGKCGADVEFKECRNCDDPAGFNDKCPADEHLCGKCMDKLTKIEEQGPCPKCKPSKTTTVYASNEHRYVATTRVDEEATKRQGKYLSTLDCPHTLVEMFCIDCVRQQEKDCIVALLEERCTQKYRGLPCTQQHITGMDATPFCGWCLAAFAITESDQSD